MTTLTSHRRQIAVWLLIVAAMIFLMVVLGGTTRLTRSGLSIVEWRLFEGTLPPLTEAHWQELFELYKKTPEYQKINVGMDLAGFGENLLARVPAPALGPADIFRGAGAAVVVPVARPHREETDPAHGGGAAAGGVERRARLVHGGERAGRYPARQPLPPDRAPGAGGSDLRLHSVDGAEPFPPSAPRSTLRRGCGVSVTSSPRWCFSSFSRAVSSPAPRPGLPSTPFR